VGSHPRRRGHPATVRSWYAKAGRTTGPTALAQSYRLLRAILSVAVADEAIGFNPCRLRGAGTPKATRPSRALTAAEALQLAEQLGRDRRTERYRALVLVLAFGGLRFGEATALRRSDVLPGGRLRVERSVRRVGGRWVVGEPKTANDSFPERRQRRIRSHAAGLQLTVDLTASRQLRCSSSGAAPSRPR
jgi:integrase